MAKTSMHFAYYLFLLTFCVDKGDGRWKKTDRENLQRDIKLYKKITERVEHELQEYYAEYEDHAHIFNSNENSYHTNRNSPKLIAKLTHNNRQEKMRQPFLSRLTKFTRNVDIHNQTVANVSGLTNDVDKNNNTGKTISQKSKWPKFDDILLAIGKKYDWKNDRWIKVKEKLKIKNNFGELDNSIMFHEKHRFSYRTIKLNRGKNKRNVVIAVTAIR